MPEERLLLALAGLAVGLNLIAFAVAATACGPCARSARGPERFASRARAAARPASSAGRYGAAFTTRVWLLLYSFTIT